MNNRHLGTLGACLIVVSLAPRTSGQTIDTIPSWNGTSFISSFGVTNTATYGQTITVTAGMGPLQQIQFEIGFCTQQVDFRFHVYAYNIGTNQATGSSLYDGGVQSVGPGAVYTLVSESTGALALAPGTYVLFVSTSQDQTIATACRFGALTNNTTYPGGQFVFMNNGTNTALWTSNTWSVIPEDLAFRAVFPAPVPTMPTSMLMVLAGLLAVFTLVRLRSRQRTA